MIEHKLSEGVPDRICEKCQQNYKGVCRAFQVAEDDWERHQRSQYDALQRVLACSAWVAYGSPEGR